MVSYLCVRGGGEDEGGEEQWAELEDQRRQNFIKAAVAAPQDAFSHPLTLTCTDYIVTTSTLVHSFCFCFLLRRLHCLLAFIVDGFRSTTNRPSSTCSRVHSFIKMRGICDIHSIILSSDPEAFAAHTSIHSLLLSSNRAMEYAQ